MPAEHHVSGDPVSGFDVHTAEGVHLRLAGDAVTAEYPVIRSVGIENLADVESHSVHRILGSTSHVVRFIGGGYVQYAFSDTGDLLVLEGHAVTAHSDPQGHIRFAPYKQASQPSPDPATPPETS